MNATRKNVLIFFALIVGCLLYMHYLMVNSTVTMKTSLSHMIRIISTPECGRFPQLIDLNVTDTYWQVTNTSNGSFYMLNAYFDDRKAFGNVSQVRIFALVKIVDPIVKTRCQLWFKGIKEIFTSEISYTLLWPKYWGINHHFGSPYLLSCKNPLSDKGLVPQFVSFVENKCDKANNVMEVRNNRPKDGRKKLFLVSVKGMFFDTDASMLIIEWCEILKILGVDKIEIFVIHVHKNVLRVLKYFERQGLVNIKHLIYVSEFPNELSQSWIQWTQNDLISFHDTFYENMYLYEYMIPMDVDEFIMPLRDEDRTWKDLIMRTIEKSRIKKEPIDSFPATNQYFLLKSIHENETIEGIPKNLRFLSNIYRAANFTPSGGNVKTFMRMDRILGVHNHFPFLCVHPTWCNNFDINTTDGELSHYRSDCDTDECKNSKKDPVRDIRLWKYKDEILKGVNETLKALEKFEVN